MELLSWLNSLQFFGVKPGLKRITTLLKRLSEPHKKLKAIHIAGTNGKGSTAHLIAGILKEHGFKVGLYTSPHLIRVNERFLINGKEIPSEKLNFYLDLIKKAAEGEKVTYFEVTTALAFLYFAEENVDFAVIECGMGGRLDATNVLLPEVSVITTIGLDHTTFLGDTLEKIAWEKAGIIKRGIPCILGKIPASPYKIIQKRASSLHSPLYSFEKDFFITLKENGLYFCFPEFRKEFYGLSLSLEGSFQRHNLAVALATLTVLEKKGFLKLKPSLLKEALPKISCPCRMHFLKKSGKTFLLDVAHNLEGIEVLKDSLKKKGFFPFLLIMGVSNADETKPYLEMLKLLLPLAKRVCLCEFNAGRKKIITIEEWKMALKENVINQDLEIFYFKNPLQALNFALSAREDRVVVTGSFYLVGEFFKHLCKEV
jgi:dihydrofolate synthase/folylpolyglutamate synthase